MSKSLLWTSRTDLHYFRLPFPTHPTWLTSCERNSDWYPFLSSREHQTCNTTSPTHSMKALSVIQRTSRSPLATPNLLTTDCASKLSPSRNGCAHIPNRMRRASESWPRELRKHT